MDRAVSVRSSRHGGKTSVLGTGISRTSYAEVLEAIHHRPAEKAFVVCVCNVHSVMLARRLEPFRQALRSADIATPDGVPLVWYLRGAGEPEQSRVYGPELMRRGFVEGESRGWKHYLLGSTQENLAELTSALARLAPGTALVGLESPPFREPTPEEEKATLRRIRESGTDVVWVGLGAPKQELWMHRCCSELPGVALVGVGAAFDFLSGNKPQAPSWMQNSGLEWLFRLLSEPRRLLGRYLWNNPAFLVLAAMELAGRRVGRWRDR